MNVLMILGELRSPWCVWLWLLFATACATDAAGGADTAPLGVDAATTDVSPGSDAAVECNVAAPSACPDPMPTYDTIEPIIEKHCLACHYGQPMGPWPLTSYEHVADWYDIIRGAMLNCTMPPPEATTTMTVAERTQLLEWLRCGYPR